MTEKEAIKILAGGIMPLNIHNSPFIHNYNKAHEMAIQALDKQIPKKPIYSDFAEDDDGEKIIPYKAVCPKCGNEFEFGEWNDEQNHHCKCGQKIDFND